MFSYSSTGGWSVGPVLQLPCCQSKQGELSENILQHLFYNLPPQTVMKALGSLSWQRAFSKRHVWAVSMSPTTAYLFDVSGLGLINVRKVWWNTSMLSLCGRVNWVRSFTKPSRQISVPGHEAKMENRNEITVSVVSCTPTHAYFSPKFLPLAIPPK